MATADSPLLLAATNEEFVYIINPHLGSRQTRETTIENFDLWEKQYNLDVAASADIKEKYVKWSFKQDMIQITFKHIIAKIVWHTKGDYFATMAHNI